MSKEKTAVTKFVLLTTQRSGSTFIRLWLNSHPYIRCHSEVFLKNYSAADGFKSYYQANKPRQLVVAALGKRRLTRSPYNFVMKRMVQGYLNELYDNPSFSAPWTDMTTNWRAYQPRDPEKQEKTVGYQLMYDQLVNYQALQDWMTDQNVSIIHLIRRNTLKLLLSRVTSKSTKQYHFSQNGGSKPKVRLDQATLLGQLNKIVAKQEEMRQKFSNNPYLEITYEQFFSDYLQESDRVLSFLGVERTEMEFPQFLKKINPDSLGDLIENYNEVMTVLTGTPYQAFLD